MEWYNQPQKIKNWKNNIDYVMFIDENGHSGSINNISKKIQNEIIINNDEKYFTITGCIFKKYDYSIMRHNIRKLKEKYWKDGYYFDNNHNESRYVCFHSRDIRRHDNAFNDSIINYDNFMFNLSNVLSKINCKIISVTINMEEYIKKGYSDNIYEKAFDLLLERYIYATDNYKKGIIILESRGKKDDKELLKHIYEIIYNKGNNKISTKELKSKIIGVYFNPKWYNGYSSTFTGLEITDLFSYPIHQYIKYKKENKAFNLIKNKIDCYPNFVNKGLKIFPKEKDE